MEPGAVWQSMTDKRKDLDETLSSLYQHRKALADAQSISMRASGDLENWLEKSPTYRKFVQRKENAERREEELRERWLAMEKRAYELAEEILAADGVAGLPPGVELVVQTQKRLVIGNQAGKPATPSDGADGGGPGGPRSQEG